MNDYTPPLPNYTFTEDLTFVDSETVTAALAAVNSEDAEIIVHFGVEYERKGTTHYGNVTDGGAYHQNDDDHVLFVELRLPSWSPLLDTILKPATEELDKRDEVVRANLAAQKAAKITRLQKELFELLADQ